MVKLPSGIPFSPLPLGQIWLTFKSNVSLSLSPSLFPFIFHSQVVTPSIHELGPCSYQRQENKVIACILKHLLACMMMLSLAFVTLMHLGFCTGDIWRICGCPPLAFTSYEYIILWFMQTKVFTIVSEG